MYKGSIDFNFEDRADVIVVDQELIFSAVRKRFKFWDYDVGLSDTHRRIIKYVIKKFKKSRADNVIVVSVDIPEKFVERTIKQFLGLRMFDVTMVDSEATYKLWLSIVEPVVHYSTFDRKNYHRASVQMTKEILDNDL